MKYSDLLKSGATDTEIQEFLKEGEMTAVTFRIPKNLKDSAMECASLQGLGFSALVRKLLIDELTRRG